MSAHDKNQLVDFFGPPITFLEKKVTNVDGFLGFPIS